MFITDDVPPLAIFCSPYGGLGLKTKSFAGARARIDGLLAVAVDVVQTAATLEVGEPASRALVERLAGPFDRGRAMGSGGRGHDLAAAVAETGHQHDEVAAEAWRRFGAPNAMAGHQERTGFWITWAWEVEDRTAAAPELDRWSSFLAAHDQRMMNDYATAIGARATWQLRLRLPGGVVADPYPPSRISAHLCGRHASAFLDLVLPHAAATQAFLEDHAAVNRA